MDFGTQLSQRVSVLTYGLHSLLYTFLSKLFFLYFNLQFV